MANGVGSVDVHERPVDPKSPEPAADRQRDQNILYSIAKLRRRNRTRSRTQAFVGGDDKSVIDGKDADRGDRTARQSAGVLSRLDNLYCLSKLARKHNLPV